MQIYYWLSRGHPTNPLSSTGLPRCSDRMHFCSARVAPTASHATSVTLRLS